LGGALGLRLSFKQEKKTPYINVDQWQGCLWYLLLVMGV
jgi:hypothetical protein